MKKETQDKATPETFEIEELDDTALAAATAGGPKTLPTINNCINTVAGCGASK